MGSTLRLIIDSFIPKIGWESRKKIEKELTLQREKIRLDD